MKIYALKMIILIALSTSGLIFSQTSRPERTRLNNTEGVFITLPVMDSISVKLIHRNFLIRENMSLVDISINLRKQLTETEEKAVLVGAQAAKFKTLFDISEQQKTAALENFENQKIMTSNIKAKARRNGLLYFGGGISLGFLVFAVLVK